MSRILQARLLNECSLQLFSFYCYQRPDHSTGYYVHNSVLLILISVRTERIQCKWHTLFQTKIEWEWVQKKMITSYSDYQYFYPGIVPKKFTTKTLFIRPCFWGTLVCQVFEPTTLQAAVWCF